MKVKAHVSDEKKRTVSELEELMKKRTVMIASVKGLPGPQFHQIKKKLRKYAVVKVAKKSLIEHALEKAEGDLKKILEHVTADYVLIFSEEDAFDLSKILADNTSPAKAKIGQEAPEDIRIEAGPTNLVPGPDISALSSVGLKPKVENGKLVIVEGKVIVKKGEVINEKVASILGKLDVTLFKIGIEPLVAVSDGKLYVNIKIDEEGSLKDLIERFSKGLAFAVSLNYVCNESLPYILGKAGGHGRAIEILIKDEVKGELKVEEESTEGKVEEKETPVEIKGDIQETKSEEEK